MEKLNITKLKEVAQGKSQDELKELLTALDTVWTMIDDVDDQHEVHGIMNQINVALRTEKNQKRDGTNMKTTTELKLTNHDNVVFDNWHTGFTTACNPRNYTYTVHSDYSNDELEEMANKYHEYAKKARIDVINEMCYYNEKIGEEFHTSEEMAEWKAAINYAAEEIQKVIIAAFDTEEVK